MEQGFEECNLDGVGILILIDEEFRKTIGVFQAYVGMVLKKPQSLHLQVIEVEHFEGPKFFLIHFKKRLKLRKR